MRARGVAVARCSKKKSQKSNKLTILLSSVDALNKRKISKKKNTKICINVFKELVTFMLFKPIRNGFHPRQ